VREVSALTLASDRGEYTNVPEVRMEEGRVAVTSENRLMWPKHVSGLGIIFTLPGALKKKKQTV